jgi:hypothetical protein
MKQSTKARLDGEYPGLNGLSYLIGYLEQLLAILSEPLLIGCAALAVVDFLTGGGLLNIPTITYLWAGSLAVSITACFIVTWRRAIRAFSLNAYGAAIGLCLMGIALGLVDWAAIDTQSLMQTMGVYVIHVQSRELGMLKTDKRDALGLANQLYNQLALGVQVTNKLQVVRRAIPPSEAAAQLKGFMRHRYELVNEATQRKNKLTAICDELFPEFTQVFKNPNLTTALDLRERFPTPQAVATASLIALREVRKRNCPSEAHLVSLQQLAATSASG